MKKVYHLNTSRRQHSNKSFFLVYLSLLISTILFPNAGSAYTADELNQCLVASLESAADSATIGELKQDCIARLKGVATEVAKADQADAAKAEESALARRRRKEAETRFNPFVITPHKPNYILLAAYNSSPNEEPFKEQFGEGRSLDKVESKFQISVKVPLLADLFDGVSRSIRK